MRILGPHLAPGRVVLAARPGHRAGHEPELDGIVVGDEQERPASPSACGRARRGTPPRPAGRRASADEVGAGRVDVPALAGVAALAEHHDRLLAAAAPHGHLEPAVGSRPARRRPRTRRAEPVQRGSAPAATTRRGRCRGSRGVRRPGAGVADALDDVGQVRAGAQVAEPEREDLVAAGVEGVGEQVLVGGDDRQAQVEVAGAGVEGVRRPGRPRAASAGAPAKSSSEASWAVESAPI